MYLTYFHLKRKPFHINTDPRFLWLGEKHKEALATLKYGIQDNKGFLLLTGDVGTGKTTLINALLNSLDEKTIVASVPDPALNRLEFFQYVAFSFGIRQPIKSKVDFLLQFGQFLEESANREQKVLLIIDEAQRLSHELLEEIRLLSNLEKQKAKLLNIFFIGQNEFNETMAEPRNRALRQRITVHYQINSLSEEEVSNYIRHRLLIAGSRKTLFAPDAVRQIYLYSNGYPRMINVICDRALLTGYVTESKLIKAKIIKDCIKELELPHSDQAKSGKGFWAAGGKSNRGREEQAGPRKEQGKRRWAYAAVPMLLLAGGSFFIFSSSDNQIFREVEETISAIGVQIGNSVPGLPERSATENIPPADLPPAAADQQLAGELPESPLVENIPVAEPPAPAGNQQLAGEMVEEIPPSKSGAERLEAESLIVEEVLSEEFLSEEVPILAAPAPKSFGPLPGIAESRPPERGAEESINHFSAEKLMINFDVNSDKLSEKAYRELERLVAEMQENPGLQVVITGYTDTSGFYHINLDISESRANMVKGFLVGRGIASHKIRTMGRGPENPIASNESLEGRRLNRRVEIEFIAGG
jgi:general secretion pathway protein A